MSTENTKATVESPSVESSRPSREAMHFVHDWLWNNRGEAKLWPAVHVRDAARMIDAFKQQNEKA